MTQNGTSIDQAQAGEVRPEENQAQATEQKPAEASGKWYDSFENSELRALVEKQQWESPESVVENYKNLEKLIGKKERLVELPSDPDDKEAWGQVYDRLGRPEKPEEYGLAEFAADEPEFANYMAEQMHELGLTKAQAKALAEKWNEYGQQILQSEEAEATKRSEFELNSLKKEWGSNYDALMNQARNAMQLVGGEENARLIEAALGTEKAMKVFQSLGEKVGEHQFINSGGGGSSDVAMSPDRAKSEIKTLMNDRDFIGRYNRGDAEARTKMERLHRMAFPS